jgi:putative acetyltransferase
VAENAVYIRGLESADWEAIAKIHEYPECQRQTLRLPYQSRDFFKQRVERQLQAGHTLVAIAETQLVGVADLFMSTGRRAHVGGIGLVVRDDYQGRGIGSQLMAALVDLSDRWLNLRRLELTVYCDNVRAIALYQKYGFEIEGTQRQYALRDGAWVDAYMMARLHESPHS